MFHITAPTASCSFGVLLKHRGSAAALPRARVRSPALELAETTNIYRRTGKGHSGKGFCPVLPVFSSISAVLKSTVQRQKASAAQLCWDHTEGQKPNCFTGVGCEDLLGLEADSFILVLCTPTVFP